VEVCAEGISRASTRDGLEIDHQPATSNNIPINPNPMAPGFDAIW
jgi:hypothetical protein